MNRTQTTTQTTTCPRCNGKGHIEGYSHIHNGVCFGCWGKGTITREKNTTRCTKRQVTQKPFYMVKRGKYQVIERATGEIKGEFSWNTDAIKLIDKLTATS